MNWGKWIILSFVLFGLFIFTLVGLCFREDISLVSKEYYKEELAYQKQIQRMQNTLALKEKPAIEIADHQLQINFKNDFTIESGQLNLFCPSNAQYDKSFELQPNPSQHFDIGSVHSGAYRVKLMWSMNGKDYYLEKDISI
ncbi:MAG TPA: hypothetical protein DGG95_13255 [Cytophagales bacterium]|jgi:hypothetical protein|nr:hypothetical protein [Cytophagales bacterium]